MRAYEEIRGSVPIKVEWEIILSAEQPTGLTVIEVGTQEQVLAN